VDSATGAVTAGPEIFARGFSDDVQKSFADARVMVEIALKAAAAEGVSDPQALQQLVRRAVGRWVNDTYRRRPMIIPVVVEV
ncbi:MAG: ribonuclease, partial [Frankiaceae bacterium]|nr:ribonuclease [Frankiaceae bacterium]